MKLWGNTNAKELVAVQKSLVNDVVVGIDFGTSATKLAFKALDDDKSTIVASNGTDVGWPSTIHFNGAEVRFALNGQDGDDASVVRWLKMLMADSSTASRDNQRLEMAHRLERRGFSVEKACSAFLAQMIQVAKRAVNRRYESSKRLLHLTYNLAAPLEAFEQTDEAIRSNTVARRFLRAFHLAERLSNRLPNTESWQLETFNQAYGNLDAESDQVPLDSDRLTFVIPEIHAAVAGAVSHGRLPDGHYVVVDVGAGTSDIAVFCNNQIIRKNNRWAVSYFADRVVPLAATNADYFIEQLVRQRASEAKVTDRLAGDVRATASSVRELHCKGDVRCYGEFNLTRNEIAASVEPLCTKLQEHFRKCVVAAIKSKTKWGHKSGYFLVRIGGGNQFKPITEAFGVPPFPKHWPKFQPESLTIDLRGRTQMWCDGTIQPLPQDKMHLFFVAHGLTTHYVRLPEPWLPSEIEDLEEPTAVEIPYIRDDDT